MNEFIIQAKNFVIRDPEIFDLIKKNRIEYIHSFPKRKRNGELSLIIKSPPSNVLTLAKGYQKVKIGKDYILFRTPKYLKSYRGKKVEYYIERLYPEPNELFRIRYKKITKTKQLPYFTSSGIFVIPYDYLNENISHKTGKLKVSFNKCTSNALQEGFMLIYIIDYFSKDIGLGGGLCSLKKHSSDLRTRVVTSFIDFMKRHNKNIHNYKYAGTMPYKNCPYGLIIFKED